MKPIYVALIAPSLATGIMVGTAKADNIPHCQLPSGASAVGALSEAPSAIQRALRDNIGEIVESGERFDSTDVPTTGHSRRLIFIWSMGNRWVVATEHGGIAYNDPIFIYNLSADGQKAELVGTRTTIPPTVCSTALSLIQKMNVE
jgi:hypothetical protein